MNVAYYASLVVVDSMCWAHYRLTTTDSEIKYSPITIKHVKHAPTHTHITQDRIDRVTLPLNPLYMQLGLPLPASVAASSPMR